MRFDTYAVVARWCIVAASTMDKSVRTHIQELENRIHLLGDHLMEEHKTQTERNRLESELRVAQAALEHYRKALEFERKLQAP
jgi:hypothetical protein